MAITVDALQLYRNGDVDGAIERLLQARELFEQPTIVFNLARAYEARGDLELATATFADYLRLAPEAVDRGAVQARLDALESQIAEQREAERDRDEARRAEQRARQAEAAEAARADAIGQRLRPGPWILGAIAVAGLGTATAFAILARGEVRDVDPVASNEEAQQQLHQARQYALGANVAYAIGGAIALGSLIWGIVNGRQRVAVDAGLGSLELNLTF